MAMKRKNDEMIIGLLLEDISSDFSKELVKSVAGAVPDGKDIRLVVLPGKHVDKNDAEWMTSYKTVYNSVFRFAKLCDFDGFIVHLGSMNEHDRKNNVMYRDDGTGFIDKPKVFVASDMRDCVTVNYNNEKGIREAVEYLVNICGLSRLCMLGGRDDNKDARARKAIFTCCLAECGLSFRERNFMHTDMTENCLPAARKLLANNPDAEAIFCVNDAVAKALYTAMKELGLVPGRDIQVFGFDNTKMSSELMPQLTSIGSDNMTLGQKALEMLLSMMAGEKVCSATVPTRLYGRDSMPYEMYSYNVNELMNVDPAFIYRMFDDCFYRYKNESISREMVDLRRLFYEIISRMLYAMKRRYMSIETFNELGKMIDKFFEKGGMNYTDAAKLLKGIERLQVRMNEIQPSIAAAVRINRLFLRMKDKAIFALSIRNTIWKHETMRTRSSMLSYITASVDEEIGIEGVFRHFSLLGMQNTALYVYDKPVDFGEDGNISFPEHVMLRCVMRDSDLYLPSKERQRCTLGEMFARSELSFKNGCLAAFPVFCGRKIYGILLCSLSGNIYDIYDAGELISSHIARSMRICEEIDQE